MNAVLDANAVLGLLRQRRDELRRLGARRLGLFGSVARGEAGAASDPDFLVELLPKTFDAYMGLKERLEGWFGRRVDLVLVDTLKPQLRERILQEAVDAEGL